MHEAKMEAQFVRAHISKQDFEEADDYLLCHRDEYPNSVKRAILVAATVSYARPFTENHPGEEGQSTPTLAVRLRKLWGQMSSRFTKSYSPFVMRPSHILHMQESQPAEFLSPNQASW